MRTYYSTIITKHLREVKNWGTVSLCIADQTHYLTGGVLCTSYTPMGF